MGAKTGEAEAWVEVEPWEVSPLNLAEAGVRTRSLGQNLEAVGGYQTLFQAKTEHYAISKEKIGLM